MPEGPARLGRYELRDVLGRGAMGTVYRAYDSVLDRTLAVKTYHPHLAADEGVRRRFEREVRATSKLGHPNIVVVYDGGLEGETPFIAMELVEGSTLEKELAARGRLPTGEALRILLAVSDALAYSHRQGVIHRDLKPANILLTASGQPKISDFGLAKLAGSGTGITTTAIGTPAHMAPEQILGQPVDQRTDVFALGILAYLLLTGEKPFAGDGITAVIYSVLNAPVTPPTQVDPNLPQALDGVLARALAKKPEERIADAGTFARELMAAFGMSPGAAAADLTALLALGGREFPVRGRAKRRWMVLPIVAALAAGLGWLGFRWSGGEFSFFDLAGPHAPPPTIAPTPAPPVTTIPSPTLLPTAKPTAAPPEPTATQKPTATTAPTKPPEPTATPQPTATRKPPPARRPTALPPPPPVAPGTRLREAPVPVAPSSELASLEVLSTPAGAELLIDGKPRGQTPVRVGGLAPGPHQVLVRKQGYGPYTRAMDLVRKGSHQLTVTLAPAAGAISIASEPPRATVYVNGAYRGETPLRVGGLATGAYEIRVELSGYSTVRQRVELVGGQEREIRVTLSRAGP